jgi:hypothetical protein
MIEEYSDKMEAANDDAYKNALQYAESRAQWEYLDEMRRTVLAGMCLKNVDLPVNHREIFARASIEYKTHLEAVRDVRRLMLISEAKVNKFSNEFELYRSKLSAFKQVTRM